MAVSCKVFALLIALFLMSVMVLLSVSLSSLVQTASRVSQDELERMQARQNAWTGLKVGVGRLQGLAGHDRRATATSDLTFPDSIEVGSSGDEDFRDDPDAFWATRNAFWTGVWRDERELGQLQNRSNPQPVFEGWLVSHPRTETPDPSAEWDEDESVVLHAGGFNRARAGTPERDRIEGRVYAPLVPFRFGPNAGGETEGRFAFWVSDEGVKGRINVPRPASFSVSALAQEQERWRLRSPQRFGWETLELFSSGSTAGVAANLAATRAVEDLERWWPAVVPASGAVSDAEPVDYLAYDVHNFTTRSLSLLTDGRRGGFRMDLSHFRAQPPGSASLALTAADFDRMIDDQAPNNLRLDHLDVLRVGGDYVRNPVLQTNRRFVSILDRGHPAMSWARDYLNPDWSGNAVEVSPPWGRPQAFHPILVAAGVYFDFTRDGNQLVLNVFPVYLLWNPYNVALAATDYTFFQEFHWDVHFELRGQVQLPNGSWFTQTIDVSSVNPLRLSTLPGNVVINNVNRAFFNVRNLQLEPGQVVVLTPENYINSLSGGTTNNGNVNRLSPSPSTGWNAENSFTIPTGFTLPGWPQRLEARFLITRQGATGQGTNPQRPRLLHGVIDPSAVANNTAAWRDANQLSDWEIFWANNTASVNFSNHSTRGHQWFEVPPASQGVVRGRRASMGLLDEVDAGAIFRGPSNSTPLIPTHPAQHPDEPILGIRYLANFNPRSPFNYRGNTAGASYNRTSGAGTRPGWAFNHMMYLTVNRDENRMDRQPSEILDNFADPEHPQTFFGPFFEVFRPDQELLSVGQLKHVQWDHQIWKGAYALGNSLAPPHMTASANEMMGGSFSAGTYYPAAALPEFHDPERDAFGVRLGASLNREQYDASFLLNDAIWDRFYFSTIPQSGTLTASPDFILPNSRYRILNGVNGAAPSTSDLRSLRETARHLAIVGGFNVNSTRVEAWKSLLGAFRGEAVRLLDGSASTSSSFPHPYPRVTNPVQAHLTPGASDTRTERAYWGFRSLSDAEIEDLAREIVREIRIRAWPDPNQALIEGRDFEHYHFRPALFLADFVNRRHVNSRYTVGALGRDGSWDSLAENHRVGVMGPLQAAINAVGINDGFNDETLYPFGPGRSALDTVEHVEGAKAAHAPGYLAQSDLLQSLGPVLTARSDTFTVRSVGERGRAGSLRLEAVLQRLPADFEGTTAAETAALNDHFGRPYRIVGYRWIGEDSL